MPVNGSPLLAGYTNYCTGATFSVGTGETVDAAFPISNLAQWSLRKPAKVTAASTPLDITVDLGSTKSDISIIFLMVKGQLSTLAWTIKVDDDSAFGSPSYDSASDSVISTGWNTSHGLLTTYVPWWGWPVIALPNTPVAGRYVRWSFTGYTLPMEVRAAVVGPRLQPAIGLPPGWSSSDRYVGEPGRQLPLRSYDVEFHCVTSTEESNLLELARYIQQSRRLVYIPQPLLPETYIREAILATMSDAASKVRNPSSPLYTSTITFPVEEVSE